MTPPPWPNHGGGVFNGDHHALYWADATAEIAFVVPTNKPKRKGGQQQQQQQQQQDIEGSRELINAFIQFVTLAH